ncbi:hypothetical protein [Paraburkholderia sp. DHOC27]|uniref:hypothetical protein n=1 Tax=Paraburkholderia sp. DHOC27 TaxID=2303330 RepID=UPI0011C14460|nr:hypothetical protein [Paraburkholderia sp. DHOC27]
MSSFTGFNSMSAEAQARFAAAHARGENPRPADYSSGGRLSRARADSAVGRDGLRKIVKVDEYSGQRVVEFQATEPNARKAWMDPWRHDGYQQICIWNKTATEDERRAALDRWEHTQAYLRGETR